MANQTYHVLWEIDLDAESPREAAELALSIMLDSESTATVFDVTDEAGETTRVDLEDTDPAQVTAVSSADALLSLLSDEEPECQF